MTGSILAKLIAIAMLTPLWWALALQAFAAIADTFPRSQIFRSFARLGNAASAADSGEVLAL